MSYNFKAGQYEGPFEAKRLGNWEVPRWFPGRPRPPQKSGFLADDNGRLLPRAKRGAPAFSNYPTAWDYPRRITRQTADDLSKEPPPGRYLDWRQSQNESPSVDIPNKPDSVSGENLTTAEKNLANEDYKPGNIASPSRENKKYSIEDIQRDAEEDINPRTGDMMYSNRTHSKSEGELLERVPLPAVDPYTGFFYARKMHMDNLLHHPLPDASGLREPRGGLGELDVKPYSTAWKLGDKASRPLTCGAAMCNKVHLKFDKFRPATSGGENKITTKNMSPMDLAICWDFRTLDPRDEPKRPKHIDGSNGSKAPAVFSMVHSPKQTFDMGFETGRSGAIFSTNILPDDTEEVKMVPSFSKDMSKNRRKEACDVPKCEKHSRFEKHSHSEKHNKSEERRIQSSDRKSSVGSGERKSANGKCDGVHGCGSSDGKESPKENRAPNHQSHSRRKSSDRIKAEVSSIETYAKNGICQSSPNISVTGSRDSRGRLHEGCCKNAHGRKNGKTDSSGSPLTSCSDAKNSVKVPKMRDPYGKKCYAIPTLAPPFSRWRDTSGYPEHWRLASVYQHAYKPPGLRRKPLLPAVYQ